VVASGSNIDLELSDRLDINEVTKQAFDLLGENGLIRSADGHTCSECTQEYKEAADIIPGVDEAGVVGMDENRAVPAFYGDEPHHENINEDEAMDVDMLSDTSHSSHGDSGNNHGTSPVKMIVMDGIVMGNHHCAFEDCTSELANARRGVFCRQHEAMRGHLCRVRGCENLKAANIQTCLQHQELWNVHVRRFGLATPLGIRRMLRRTEQENLPWAQAPVHQVHPHDEPMPVPAGRNYFVAPRFYCVETICAPCGVVIAWTKFAKAESPSNILNFLDRVYPTVDLKPDYVCIDKACLVLRHAVASERWDEWKDTTRFIVDSYHYINHRTTDYLCRKYCNPAPLNGSAPNLVIVEEDIFGQPHYKCAFNTQVGSSCTCTSNPLT
jgi:hypothetical protein